MPISLSSGSWIQKIFRIFGCQRTRIIDPIIMFTLIDLPYPIDALEPVISAKTLEFHHGKHLNGYVDNLNKLIAGTEFESMSLEDIIRHSTGPIFNNAGQILNHNLYFTQFRPARVIAGEGPSFVISSEGAAEVEKSLTTFEERIHRFKGWRSHPSAIFDF